MAKNNFTFAQPLDRPVKTADEPLLESNAPGSDVHSEESADYEHPSRARKGDRGFSSDGDRRVEFSSDHVQAGALSGSFSPAVRSIKRAAPREVPFDNVKVKGGR